MSQLQELDLVDFTGGLNARANVLQVADNESPRMLNMEIEPGRGFFTRKGWERWNEDDITDPAAWNPRSADVLMLSDGSSQVYVANDEAGKFVHGYLTPTVGTVSTPDPVTIPADSVWVFKVRGPNVAGDVTYHTIASHSTPPESYSLTRYEQNGSLVMQESTVAGGTGDTWFVPGNAPIVAGGDEWLAVARSWAAGTQRLTSYRSFDGNAWTQLGTATNSTPDLFSSVPPLLIGTRPSGTLWGGQVFDGRIYWVEQRTGLNPSAGAVLWRFDADDYPGTGTSYTDPRGRTWTLTAAGAITPKIDIPPSGIVYAAGDDGKFTNLGIVCDAPGHLADFTPWGNSMYIVCGTKQSKKRITNAAPVGLVDASTAWNPNYTTPDRGNFPIAQHVQAHASYIFVAGTTEQGLDPGPHPNRIRWSHPDEPEDWAADDFLDIETGGGQITALRSFQDHLLIFKTDSLWALYGYDLESWQLVRVSRAIGTPTPTAVAQSESMTYFFSASGRGGVYAYDGNTVTEISVPIRPIVESILPTRTLDVWMGFVCHKLWVSLPWQQDDVADGSSIGVYDPDINDGVWVGHRPALGSMRSIIEGSDVNGECALAVLSVPPFVDPDPGNPTLEEDPDRSHPGAACLVRIEMLTEAQDRILATGEPTPFFAEYQTNWKHMGKPELRKSFLRTRFLAPRQETATQLRLDVYWDYDTTTPRRSLAGVVLESGAQVLWRETGANEPLGFDFKEFGKADPSGRGADFGETPGGSLLGRTNLALGVCRAVQLHFFTVGAEAGKPWGFDGIFMKVRFRRFTT